MFAVAAGGLGAVAFTALAALIVIAPRGNRVATTLLVASTMSALWLAVVVLYNLPQAPRLALTWVQVLELARDACWILFLTRLLGSVRDDRFRRRIYTASGLLLATLAAAAIAITNPYGVARLLDIGILDLRKGFLLAALLSVLGGLVLVEQLFRNTARDARWALKHLCFGLGLIFAYDFYLYADAVLFSRIDPVIWASRGVVNALAVPMIALSVSRNREWNLNIFVSRRIVFHGVSMVAAGVYLLAMAAAGYYIQTFGGEWGRALKTAFFSAAILILLSLFFSSQVRSRIRLFVARHFYRNKYEYGDEWLNFTQALSRTALEPGSLNRTVLQTIADIVDSPGGVIMTRVPGGGYGVAATLSVYEGGAEVVADDATLVRLLAIDAQPFDLSDEHGLPDELAAALPQWLRELPRVGPLVPIVHREELLAFLVLARRRSNEPLDHEDLDLLKTVGRQAAGYLALMRATDELSEARQFETFNRLSAFLVHDLKNVVAQLSLIVRNAERHRDNREFVDDAFRTVGDAVAKMNRMLASLRQMNAEAEKIEAVRLDEIVTEIVASCAEAHPAPAIDGALPVVRVNAVRDRLHSIVEHLVQNAIDATAEDGSVMLRCTADGNNVQLCITDTGCGMDQDFISNRLFRPFDTTKGKAGMGIGAYEARQVVSALGGSLHVESEPGTGSMFKIVLPLADTGTDA